MNKKTKEVLIGMAVTVCISLMGWTAANTHLMVVNAAVYQMSNNKDHEAISLSIKDMRELSERAKKKADQNEKRIITLEAVMPKRIKVKNDDNN